MHSFHCLYFQVLSYLVQVRPLKSLFSTSMTAAFFNVTTAWWYCSRNRAPAFHGRVGSSSSSYTKRWQNIRWSVENAYASITRTRQEILRGISIEFFSNCRAWQSSNFLLITALASVLLIPIIIFKSCALPRIYCNSLSLVFYYYRAHCSFSITIFSLLPQLAPAMMHHLWIKTSSVSNYCVSFQGQWISSL